ncbi:MAG: hypothetical protein ACLU4N_14580 [Butyricimonas faecihominis]
MLNDLNPDSATRLYQRARLSLALSTVDFLLENIARDVVKPVGF